MITDSEIDRYIQSYIVNKFGIKSLKVSYFHEDDNDHIPCNYVTYTCNKWAATQGDLWLHKSDRMGGASARACVWFNKGGTKHDAILINRANDIIGYMDKYFTAISAIPMSQVEMTTYIDQYADVQQLADFIAHIVHGLHGIKLILILRRSSNNT